MLSRRKEITSILNLKYKDILVDDVNEESFFFNISEVPDSFPIGFSSFRIKGSEFLKSESEVLIEILYEPNLEDPDETKRIYHEAIYDVVDQNNNIIVSVAMYDDMFRDVNGNLHQSILNGTAKLS